MIKRILFIFFLIIVPVSAQVTSVPQFPTEYDSIKITFDASLGGRGMMGYTGDVYTHTGVITNLSGGQWTHVIGNWGDNTVQPRLTRIGTDLYTIVIGYPRTFYSVTNSSEHILKLAFVFRSADAARQTEDLFLDIYSSGLTVVVNNPVVSTEFGDPLRSPALVNSQDTIHMDIQGVAIQTQVSSVKLYIDNDLAAQTNQSRLYYDFIAADYTRGVHNAVVIARDTASLADTLSFAIVINPDVVDAPVPAGCKPGINIGTGYDVTFVLFAPYKQFVYLIGSFNDWKIGTNYFMKRDQRSADSVLWHITLPAITPGTERLFQYFVDGKIRIADPYSEKVLDPWNDQYISSATYPNLTPYPAGKTAYPVTAFTTGQQPYQWHTTNYVRPKKTDLVIYELLLRDFLASHDFKTLRDTIMYLKNLGVNAIELMPVNEFEGNESWGYNPSFYFAVDKYYGPADDFKAFVDTCHSLGMAVIMDIVLNHSYGQSPLVRLYFNSETGQPLSTNPWYNVVSPNPQYSWGYDFNHESIHTKNFVDRVNKYWLSEYKVDGFRFDFTKGFTNTPGEGSPYDASRIAILTRMANKIRETDSSAYVILEHFCDNSEETVLSNNGMMLWGNINYQYNEATMGYSSDLSWGVYKTRSWSQPNLVSYMESHDEERLMYKNLRYGNSFGDYNIKDIRTALNRQKLAAAFFLTIPGPKMIWQFGELGYDISIDDPCRVCNKPIKWDYFSDYRRNKLYRVYSVLNKLRTEQDAFESSDFTYDLSNPAKRIKIISQYLDVIVIGNFGVTTNSISPQFTRSGTWYDYFSGDSITVGDPFAARSLEPGEFHMFTSLRLPPPEPGILLDAEDAPVDQVFSYNLEQNYPNPFNPETVIRYQVPERGFVSLKIYDIIGREITALVSEEKAMGQYEVNFNASGLSSGIYFYKLETGSFSAVKKMILIK